MICQECGNQNAEGAKFCIKCGKNVQSPATLSSSSERKLEHVSTELKDSGTVTTLAVIGFVFGLIGMMGSFIPCLGSFAFFIGIPATLISAIGLFTAYSQHAKKTFAIVALTISLIGVVISGFQYFSIIAAGTAAKNELDRLSRSQMPAHAPMPTPAPLPSSAQAPPQSKQNKIPPSPTAVAKHTPVTSNTEAVAKFINSYLEQTSDWRVKIHITSLNEGVRSGSFDFRSLNCGGYVTFVGKQDNGYLFKENLNYGNCVPGCEIWLSGDGTLYKEICNGKVTGTGYLQYAN